MMKYIDEYRDKKLISGLADLIARSVRQKYIFMEVCGGHTNAIHRFGISALIPDCIRLISGPGCPVCVTGKSFIDKAVAILKLENIIIATFGDLIRVPGSASSLEKERSSGSDIRIVLSALEALEIAKLNPEKKIVFPGIGFETTAPGTAVVIKLAEKDHIGNFFLLNAHKVMPPAMEAIIRDGTNIDGFICPGHVAAITGSSIFNFIPEKYNLGCCVTGFEPADLMQSILMLVRQKNNNSPKVEIQYNRAVTETGNLLAQKNLSEVFEPCDDCWRGFGVIPDSGMKLQKKYEKFDADKVFSPVISYTEDDGSCICGEILRGIKSPADCPLFATVCVPENPTGACMVSNEGTCNTWFRYKING
ncbi:MAG: hydrogenase formation protein HypD [Bacteroidales bacterium]|jgi:hydrogenase expression/formation protein HypD|nr:hydrogenase formation protein HypD [Bacteroidales bacterium]